MIAFTSIPYHEIKEREENQQAGLTILLSVVTMLSIALLSEGATNLLSPSSAATIQNLPKLIQSALSSALHSIKPPGMR
jgi:hypothetical protein